MLRILMSRIMSRNARNGKFGNFNEVATALTMTNLAKPHQIAQIYLNTEVTHVDLANLTISANLANRTNLERFRQIHQAA